MNCPKCSANNTPEAMFCAVCGTPLNAAPPVAPYQPPVSEAPVVEQVPEAPAAPSYTAPAAPVAPSYTAPAAPSYTAPTYNTAPQQQQYQSYQQQPYASVPQYSAPVGDTSKNWAGVTSMITGISSILCCITAFGGVILSIAAIVFGVMGLKSQKKGMAIAGLITGCIGIVLSFIMLVAMLSGEASYYYDYYIY